jgi:hypothetical protein
MSEELGHVPVEYPSVEDGMHAVRHVISHAVGNEELAKEVLIANSWVALGAGLSMAFPIGVTPEEAEVEDAPHSAEKPVKITAQERKVLEQFQAAVEEKKQGRAAPDWKKLAKMAMEILMKFLCLMLVLGLVTGTASAQQFDIEPPKPVFTITQGKVDKIEGLRKELDKIEDGIKKLEADRANAGRGFPSPNVPAPADKLSREFDKWASDLAPSRPAPDATRGGNGECKDGSCCDEKGGPSHEASRQGNTAFASAVNGRSDDTGLGWADAKRLALQQRKPLLKWVGDDLCPRCVDDTKGEFVHTFAKHDANYPQRSVAVMLPGSDGYLYEIGVLTGWTEGSAKWGHAASVRKMVKAFNEGRPTTIKSSNGKQWAAPELDPSMGPAPDSPMWMRTGMTGSASRTLALHDPAPTTFRDPVQPFVVTPTIAPQPQVFIRPPMMTHQPMMMSAPMYSSGSRMGGGMMRGRRGGGCAGGSCG